MSAFVRAMGLGMYYLLRFACNCGLANAEWCLSNMAFSDGEMWQALTCCLGLNLMLRPVITVMFMIGI